jgi:hypothetical protein
MSPQRRGQRWCYCNGTYGAARLRLLECVTPSDAPTDPQAVVLPVEVAHRSPSSSPRRTPVVTAQSRRARHSFLMYASPFLSTPLRSLRICPSSRARRTYLLQTRPPRPRTSRRPRLRIRPRSSRREPARDPKGNLVLAAWRELSEFVAHALQVGVGGHHRSHRR